MQKKKSRFWLFIWSLVPGAGHMYLGFMKMGISLMLGFMTLIAVAALTNLGVLAIFPVAVYVYSFFHANNLGTLNDAEFYAIKDQYLLGLEGLDSIEKMRVSISQKYRKVAATVLIIVGVIMIWQTVFSLLYDIFGWNYLRTIYYFTRDDLPRIVIGIAIIWFGVSLIRGKKVDSIEEDRSAAKEQNSTNGQNVFNAQNATNEQNASNAQDSHE